MFIVIFIITLLILVVIHELGHFLMAKKFGIKVLEFGFGIPPRAIGKKIGETIYSLNWLPFGGFVRLLGEDEPSPHAKGESEDSRYFSSRPVWQRILVVIAGVVMNLVLAWVIFWIVLAASNFKAQLPLITKFNFIGVHQSVEKLVIINGVSPGSPAEQAGIKSGDRVVAVNDRFIKDSNELITITREHKGEKIKLTLSDLEQKSYKTVEAEARENPPKGQGALGISLGSFDIANLEYREPWQKILAGPIHSLNFTLYTGRVLSEFISVAVEKKDIAPVRDTVAGPIGIAVSFRDLLSIKEPLLPLLTIIGALSLNLAVFNIFPIPGLDGGRLLFLVIEGITRKKVNATVERYVHTAGLALLLVLILLITVSDIRKFIL